MTRLVILRVRGFAASTLDGVAEMADLAEELHHDDAEALRLLARSYRDGALRFAPSDADAIGCALSDLSNTEDAYAEDSRARREDPDGARFAGWARDGLSGLASRAWRSAC